MGEGGMVDGVNIAKMPPSSSRCKICNKVKDVKKNLMMNSCCPVHFGYACYTCLRKYYIEKPKTVYDFPFQCHVPDCHHVMSHNWIQSFFAKGGRQMTMRDCRSEYVQYCKMTRLARQNERILGSNWKIILKDLRKIAVIMGISGPLARNPWRDQFEIKKDLDGFAKCCHCRTIVLKDGGCDQMTCPSCGVYYSYKHCELNIHAMDIGYVRLSSDTTKDNQRRRRHIRPRLVTVKEDATTLWEGEIGDYDVEHDEEKVFFSDDDDDDDDDETKTSSNENNDEEEEEDAVTDIGDGFSAVDADEDMNQSWSVVSLGEHTRLPSSASSFSVVSGIESVCSFDDFSDLASIGDATGVAEEKVNPLPLGISYCYVVKKTLVADIDTVSQNKIPRRNRTANQGIAAKPTTTKRRKDKNDEDEDDENFIYDDCLKYNGRGGKQSLRCCGGKSRSGQDDGGHRFVGSKLTRKERKIRKAWKRRPGQRCGFQTTKSAVQQYYGTQN